MHPPLTSFWRTEDLERFQVTLTRSEQTQVSCNYTNVERVGVNGVKEGVREAGKSDLALIHLHSNFCSDCSLRMRTRCRRQPERVLLSSTSTGLLLYVFVQISPAVLCELWQVLPEVVESLICPFKVVIRRVGWERECRLLTFEINPPSFVSLAATLPSDLPPESEAVPAERCSARLSSIRLDDFGKLEARPCWPGGRDTSCYTSCVQKVIDTTRDRTVL